MPVEWAQTMMNLATAYSDRIRGDKAENIEAAIAAYQQVLQEVKRESLPTDYVRATRGLGRVLFEQARYSEAMAHMQAVLSTVEEMYEAAPTPTSRQSLLQELGDTPQRLAFALCRTDGADGSRQAVVVLEQNRARWLREALEMSSARPADVPTALWSAFQTQAQRVRELQAEAQLPDHTPGRRTFLALSALLTAARADLSAAVDAIRAVAPDFLPKPTFAQIQSAAQDGPLVYLLATAAGGLALIVHTNNVSADFADCAEDGGGSVEAVWLDGLTTTEISKILYDQEGEAGGRYLRGAAGGDHAALTATLAWALPLLGARLAQPLAERLAARYPQGTPVTLVAASNLGLLPLHAAPVMLAGRSVTLLDFFGVRYAPSATALRRHSATGHTSATVRRPTVVGVGNPLPAPATGRWAQQRVADLLPALAAIDADRHLLPLSDDLPADAAAPLQALRRLLLERWRALLRKLEALSTLPTEEMVRTGQLYQELLLLLSFLQAVETAPLAAQAAALAQRLPASLEAAEAEAYSVRDLVGRDNADLLFNHAATAAALWERLPTATWLHLACHGRFDVRQPLESALLLAEGTQITLRELLDPAHAAALQQVRLAFLSACQTAISDFRSAPEEVVGLPAALLQAGVPAVIGTLWPVNDRSTALLVNRFYELALHGDASLDLPPQPPLHALRLAQAWLREIDNDGLKRYLETHRSLSAAPAAAGDRMSGILYRDEQRRIRDALQRGQGHKHPYAEPYHWAPFVIYGVGQG